MHTGRLCAKAAHSRRLGHEAAAAHTHTSRLRHHAAHACRLRHETTASSRESGGLRREPRLEASLALGTTAERSRWRRSVEKGVLVVAGARVASTESAHTRRRRRHAAHAAHAHASHAAHGHTGLLGLHARHARLHGALLLGLSETGRLGLHEARLLLSAHAAGLESAAVAELLLLRPLVWLHRVGCAMRDASGVVVGKGVTMERRRWRLEG